MLPRKNFIATSAWILTLAITASLCQAQSIGAVTDLQGTLLSKNAAGTIKILALDSRIEPGEHLLTRSGAYARMVLTDGTAVTLGPESELTIVRFSYSDSARSNSALLDFIQGRLQIAAGRVGARSIDHFMLNTSSGTIAVGHATFIAGYTTAPRTARLHSHSSPQADRGPSADVGGFEAVVYHPPADGASGRRLLLAQNTMIAPAGIAPAGGLAPGLYVQVTDGAIHLTNAGGSQNFSAGQFGFTPSFQQPPVILPSNPGMQFTPPPSFNSTAAPGAGSTGSKPGDVNCQVR
jgi:hypothetical protein